MTINAKDFHDTTAKAANKLVDFYEGKQRKYVVQMLDGKYEGGLGSRADWRARGFIPRVRNITKSIADKRALLFNLPPKLELMPPGSKKAVVSESLMSILHDADWIEFWQVVDVYVGLLRSVIVLQQKYIPEETTTSGGIYRYDSTRGDGLMLTMLHRGNSVVRLNATGKRIVELAFLTEEPCEDDEWTYTRITPELYVDVLVKGDGEEIVTARRPNLDGLVPATFVYDTSKPRNGAWADIPEDLPSFQELVNLHLTDLEHAVAQQKQKTLFTDAKIVSGDAPAQVHRLPETFDDGGAWRYADPKEKVTFGLGAIVTLQGAMGGDRAPMLKFDGPESDLTALDNTIRALVQDLGHDWDVNLRVAGSSSATSGFQLIVEEIGNLSLREKRAQSFQAAFRRFYEITRALYPELPEGSLWIEFAPPSLPVNLAEQEQLWTVRIQGQRASPIDYLMEVKGLTEEEAIEKLTEIKKWNDLVKPLINTEQQHPETAARNDDGDRST